VNVERVSMAAAAALLCLLVGTSALPDATVVGQEGPRRSYIVMLDVPDAGEAIRTSRRSGRQRARERAADTRRATDRISARFGIQPRHRYSAALSGFSARLTRGEAAELARDSQVARVRPARRVRPAAQLVPPGIRRVNAGPAGAAPNVDVDIAIIDTGIGPAGDELNVVGGVNCLGGPPNDFSDADALARHGTHVAGIAAARDNDKGVVGVAPGARLWAVRVMDDFGGDEATVVCGIDWAVATRLAANPEDEKVDVINMSLQAARLPFVEACGPSDPDPIHVAVCAADAAGISVVVAAGNVGFGGDRRAANVVPAAYDQVITVAAINDYDGEGGGLGAATCSGGGLDDRFGGYSRFGPDVDIVAPGTCVRSTTVGSGGTATRVLSGTSMASPHVAGAVARYLADHPDTSPQQMRRLVRAAGRLDWFPASDPEWSGVADTDPPSRVVDVAALVAGQPDLRVWLSSDRFRVGGTETRRRARVDVQRIGGWGGVAQLDVEGLPGAVGAATFDRPSASLDGLTALGARLTLELEPDGPQGPRDLSVRAAAPDGSPSASRGLALLVDRKGPRVSGLRANIRGDVPLATTRGAAEVTVRWSISDTYSRVSKAVLQRKSGTGPWRAIVGRRTSARVTMKPGRIDRFRVRARDSLGNTSRSAAVSAELVVRDSASAAWLASPGDWRRRVASSALGGSLLVAKGRTPSLRTTLSGRCVAIVAPVGPERGWLRVRLDGGSWEEVSLRRTRSTQRRVVYAQSLGQGTHSLEIQGLSGQTAVDAILFVR